MRDSHFREFPPGLWNARRGEGGFDDVVEIARDRGLVIAHCAGAPAAWESRFGGRGAGLALKIREMAAELRDKIRVRIIEIDHPTLAGVKIRQRLPMSAAVPPGATVIDENRVPHLWLGQVDADVD